MHDLFKGIWAGLRAICKRLVALYEIASGFLQSALTWLVGLVTLFVKLIFDKINAVIHRFVDTVSSVFDTEMLGSFPSLPPLAAYWLRDVFAMDVAFDLLVDVALLWVTLRAARLLLVPIRALLELL